MRLLPSVGHSLPRLAALLLCGTAAVATSASAQSQPTRQVVEMDTARARALYVSNKPEDHPVSNYARAIERKQVTDSIFAARSAGRMSYSKTSYKSNVDGMEIPVYVFAPLTPRGNAAHAAMVWVHGGVHGNWDQNYLPFILDAVERGYVIIAPEYRGSTGYGEAHHRAIDYGGYEVDDVLSAYDFAATIPAVDTSRVGVMGWSHGGFITAHLLFRGETPFKGGVAMVPVTNLLFRLSYKGPRYQRSFATQTRIQGLPFEKREEYKKRSPYYHVDSLRTPMLVHVATNDDDVNFEESEPLIDALRSRKAHWAETKIYVDPTPGPSSRGHTFNRRVNRQTLERDDSPEQIDSWNLVWAFWEKWLAPSE